MLTFIQHGNYVLYCQELLQESKVNLDNYFDHIVAGDEKWIYDCDLLSQQEVKFWKKPGEETSTRLYRIRLAKKIMMVIFWNKYGILLTEYLPRGTTISGLYYALIIEQFCCAILEKRDGKVSDEVLFLHHNAPVHKCNIAETAIGKAGFVELNQSAYSPDIAPSDYYLFSNLKKFLCGKNMMKQSILLRTI